MRTVFSKIYRSVPSNLRLRCHCPYPYLKLFVSLWHSSLGGERFGGVLKSPAVEGKVDKSFTESVPTLYRRPPFGKGSAMHRSVVYWACAQRSGRNHFRDVLRMCFVPFRALKRSSVVGAGQTNEHVHEGREELGGEKVTAGCDELVQAQLPLKGPVTPKICIQIRCYRCYLPRHTVLDTNTQYYWQFTPSPRVLSPNCNSFKKCFDGASISSKSAYI